MKGSWQFRPEDVLMSEEAWDELRTRLWDTSKASAKRAKRDHGWFEEHQRAFAHKGLSYPPDLASASIDYSFIPQGGVLVQRGWGGMCVWCFAAPGRMEEAAFFYVVGSPVQAEHYGVWHFVDLNPTLGRSLGLGAMLKWDDDLTGVVFPDPWTY
eukprot:849376-Karenia_brevis.AAC.1